MRSHAHASHSYCTPGSLTAVNTSVLCLMQATARTLTLNFLEKVLCLAVSHSHDGLSRMNNSLVVDTHEPQLIESLDLMAVANSGRARRSASGGHSSSHSGQLVGCVAAEAVAGEQSSRRHRRPRCGR